MAFFIIMLVFNKDSDDERVVITRRHIKCRTASKVGGDSFRSGKAEIGKFNGKTSIGNQNIFRLQIAVVDP